MYCAKCGAYNQDGARFCQGCGASLLAPGGLMPPPAPPPAQPTPSIPPYQYPVEGPLEEQGYVEAVPGKRVVARRSAKSRDPYKDEIKQLKLQIKQLKLDLKQVTMGMSNTRAQYNQTATFVPHGLLRRGYKMLEDIRLLGPQRQKQELQEEILQLEQQLLGLQQAQLEWKAQQGG